jgi:hypothetical protein
MDEDDPVHLTLLEVRRCHQESDPQADDGERCGSPGEPGQQPAREGIEGLGGSVAVQAHSIEVLRLSATTKGALTRATSITAPSKAR